MMRAMVVCESSAKARKLGSAVGARSQLHNSHAFGESGKTLREGTCLFERDPRQQ
jgi:hypothetical protein